MPKVTSRTSTKSNDDGGNRASGFIFNKVLGQHILKNPLVVNGIVEKVGISIHSEIKFQWDQEI